MNKYINSLIQKDQPGVCAAVIEDQKCIFRHSCGAQDLKSGNLISSTSSFHVASLSKQFTALSIYLLENRGLLKTSDKAGEYLPRLSPLYSQITIDHLIHHTGGIRDQWDLLHLQGFTLGDELTNKQIITLLNKQEGLNFPPGSDQIYCSSGYTILAEVIEAVSGECFADFTKREFFAPLEMTSTFFNDHNKAVANKCESYRLFKGQYTHLPLNIQTVGATGLKTTLEDMIKWETALQDKDFFHKEILDKSYEQGALSDGSKGAYGGGVVISSFLDEAVFRHNGSDAGFRSHFLRFRDRRLSVIVLSNNGSLFAGQICNQLIRIMDGKTPSCEKPASSPEVGQNTKLKKTGLFVNSENLLSREIILHNGDFQMITPDGTIHELSIQGSESFSLKTNPLLTYKLYVNELHEIWRESVTVYTLTVPAEPDRSITGSYVSEELNRIYTIYTSKEGLFIQIPGFPPRELIPVSTDTYMGRTVPWDKNTGVLNLRRIPSGIEISTRDVKGLVFRYTS